ncbi:hypothetical protein RIF29_09419 [Crotalaria pallida]|uniref:Pectinesterase inhibitor domain-containing protein n=1 Tax=Crotalaria pallida TaxID=3830 RepID=A0AAN9FRW0_CROPI
MSALGESLYEKVCKETKDLSCLQLLKVDPRIPSAKSYHELSKFILELGINKGKEGQNYMKEIEKKNPIEGIKLCANQFYNQVITSFQSAIMELEEDIMSATYDAKIAGDGVTYCVERLQEVKIANPLINKECPMSALGESLYDKVCKETKDLSCLQLLKVDPRIPSAKSYHELSKFILELGIKKGKEGQNYMKEIEKKNPIEGIKLCANQFYNQVITSFQSAIMNWRRILCQQPMMLKLLVMELHIV